MAIRLSREPFAMPPPRALGYRLGAWRNWLVGGDGGATAEDSNPRKLIGCICPVAGQTQETCPLTS
jgi:hypothetical protein